MVYMWKTEKIIKLNMRRRCQYQSMPLVVCLGLGNYSVSRKDTHGSRNMNANPIVSLRLRGMNSPQSRKTANPKMINSVAMSNATMNCQRLDLITSCQSYPSAGGMPIFLWNMLGVSYQIHTLAPRTFPWTIQFAVHRDDENGWDDPCCT